METTIYIQNLKCGGCAKTITNNLTSIENIENVIINVENSSIILTHHLNNLLKVKQILKKIGYPEQGEDNTIFLKAKSFVSCAVGKIT
jgi:copper chaperone